MGDFILLALHPRLCPEQLSFHFSSSPICKDHLPLPQERAQNQVSPGWWSPLVVQAKTQPTKRLVKGFPRPEISMLKPSLFSSIPSSGMKTIRAIQGCLELGPGQTPWKELHAGWGQARTAVCVGSWGRARRAPRPPCLGLKSSPPFYSCVILITMEFSKWAPCWTKTRILGILPSYTPVDERSWLNKYSLIPECRLHAWKYMLHQRIAKSMTIFFFLVLVFFALFPFSHTPSSF